MNKKLKSFIILIIFIMLAIACVNKSMIQNDTFYLIKLGKDILHNGIDLLDHYSWIGGLAYTYPHWLHSIIIYLSYSILGYDGLYIYSVIVFVASAASIYYINQRINKDKFIALLISLMSFPLLKDFINPRSQSISGLLFLWEVYFIIQLIKTGNKKYIIYLVIDSLLIANIHGTAWLMFFIFFLPFMANQIIYQIMKKKKLKNKFANQVIIEKIDNIKPLLIAFVLCFLVGISTPSRICYTYVIKIAQGESQSYIMEHAPLAIISAPMVFVSLFLLYFSKEKIKLHELFMIMGMYLMTFIAIRHLQFFYTIGLLYLSMILMRNVNTKKDQTLSILYNKITNNKLIMTLLLLISVGIGTITLISNTKIDYIDKETYPVDAVNYVKENLDYQNIKLYNHYNHGSYLLFNDIKVFIDSRCDLYLKEFNSQYNIFEDYLAIDDDHKYEEMFEKYDIEYALLSKKDTLHFILKNDSNYEMVYQDEHFIIYYRNVGGSNEKTL